MRLPLLLEAYGLLAAARLRRDRFVAQAALTFRPANRSRSRSRADEQAVVVAAQLAVQRANRAIPISLDCLQRTVVLHTLLARRGIATTPVLGVRRLGGKLEAHAWLEYEGEILTSSAAHCDRYHRLQPVPDRARRPA